MSVSKSVLITGASKGIGRAIAIQAAKADYNVVIHYGQDQVGALLTLKEIEALGKSARMLSFDISNREECKHVLEEDLNHYGSYYGIVLNAGIACDNAFPALEDDEWDKVIHTNLDGFYNVLKPLVMPMIRARQAGRIVTLSSVSGMVGNRGQVNYSASKAGIIGASKALALELAKRNITVNCVAPGIIETQMTSGLPAEIEKIVPLRRMGHPKEVAAAVLFLLSEDAAYITRQVIAVNGGLV